MLVPQGIYFSLNQVWSFSVLHVRYHPFPGGTSGSGTSSNRRRRRRRRAWRRKIVIIVIHF
jgi:hypothetical protein